MLLSKKGPPVHHESLFSLFRAPLIALLVTLVIGELGIKDSVLGYFNDSKAITDALAADDTSLQNLIVDLDSLVLDRVNAAEVQSDFAVNNNVAGFVSRYADYYKTVQKWTADRYGVEQRLAQYAGCKLANPDCPGHGIFLDDFTIDFSQYVRGDRPKVAPSFSTASEEFRYLNALITDSLRRPIISCAARAAELTKASVAACPFSGGWAQSAAANCIYQAVINTTQDVICPQSLYFPGQTEALAAFGADHFGNIRSLLTEAKAKLLAMQEAHLTGVCEKNQTILTRWFYNCQLAAKLEMDHHPMPREAPF